MPYFNNLNSLFIHIPKNAGRSIESALFPVGVTSSSGKRSMPNRIAHLSQNITSNPTSKKYIVGTIDVSLSGQHLTYAEIELLGLLPKEVENKKIFKFCVVRNPYERTVSSILHFKSKLKELKYLKDDINPKKFERAVEIWSDFIPTNHNHRAHRRPQADFIFSTKAKNVMDMILRFENLSADFKNLVKVLGSPKISLPWVGGSMIKNENYKDLLTPRSIKIIEDIYDIDIEMFGYNSPK